MERWSLIVPSGAWDTLRSVIYWYFHFSPHRPVCHDCSFHLHRPTPRHSPRKPASLFSDRRRHVWLLLHPGLGGLRLHLHQRPHVPDPEEAQIDTRHSVALTQYRIYIQITVLYIIRFVFFCCCFLFCFVVFLANILFPLKAKKKKEKSFCILEIREQTVKAGIHNSRRRKVPTRQSQKSSNAQILKCSAACFLTTGMGCEDRRPRKPGLGGHLPRGWATPCPPHLSFPYPNLWVLMVEGGVSGGQVRDETSSGV